MTTSARTPAHPIEPLFTKRWSPRAYDGSSIPQAALDSIFEAARWAPSAFNYQPWRFVYAHRGRPDWQRFMDPLLPFNQSWAKNAAVLLYLLSDTLMEQGPGSDPKASYSHSFDVGAAWALIALQATRLGYHAHGMTGVDFDAARIALNAPERFRIEAAVAIGRQGDKASLPEALREREVPSGRKPIEACTFAGAFPG